MTWEKVQFEGMERMKEEFEEEFEEKFLKLTRKIH